MNVDQWNEFTQSALATSAALVLILLLRTPLRRALGARTAYAAWAFAPLCLFAVLVPAPATGLAFLADAATRIGLPQGLAASTPTANGVDLQALLVWLWITGALIAAAASGSATSKWLGLIAVALASLR